jgi:hypothetical protein
MDPLNASIIYYGLTNGKLNHSVYQTDKKRDNPKIRSLINKEIDMFLYRLLKNPITFNIKNSNIKDYAL